MSDFADEQSSVPYGEPIRYVFGDWTADELQRDFDAVMVAEIKRQPYYGEWMMREVLRRAYGAGGTNGPM